jgi:hypothetical protein
MTKSGKITNSNGNCAKISCPISFQTLLMIRTLSADQVIGEIIDGNNSFIPTSVDPNGNGEFGSTF